MMDVIARNYNARAAECALFEDTTTYTPNADPDQLPTETETLMLGAYGAGWDYLGLKGVVEKLLETAALQTRALRATRRAHRIIRAAARISGWAKISWEPLARYTPPCWPTTA